MVPLTLRPALQFLSTRSSSSGLNPGSTTFASVEQQRIRHLEKRLIHEMALAAELKAKALPRVKLATR